MLHESAKGEGEGSAKEISSRRVVITRLKAQNPVSSDVEGRLKLMVTFLGSEEGMFCLTLVHAMAEPFDHFNSFQSSNSSFKVSF
jgi:hypothetical protein